MQSNNLAADALVERLIMLLILLIVAIAAFSYVPDIAAPLREKLMQAAQANNHH